MTVEELNNEFDIYYNSIASNSAPGIDLYEKSVYLTRAQLEIVNNYFNPRGNKYNKGFEQNSKRRVDFKQLIRSNSTSAISAGTPSDEGISEDSQFFIIPKEVYLIIQEKVRVTSDDLCINNTFLKVKPITHDEFNVQENNPFKKPNEQEAWRMEYYNQDALPLKTDDPLDDTGVVELISPYIINLYKFRYIKFPSPIILTDLTTEYPTENLSIDGSTAASTSELGKHIHREILNRAVELATADYNSNSLPVKMQINQRNE